MLIRVCDRWVRAWSFMAHARMGPNFPSRSALVLFTIGLGRLGQCTADEYGQLAHQHVSVVREISSALHNTNAAVVCGLLEQQLAGYYNTATVILGSGTIERYRQKSPASVASTGRVLNVLPGEYRAVTLWSRFRIGLMVCNDHWGADDFFKHYKATGAHAVLLIADSLSPNMVRETFSKKCREYRLQAIICNSAGQYKGGSCLIDCEGHFVPLRTSTNLNTQYWIRRHASGLIKLLIGGIMTTAITVPHIQRKPELLGDGIHNEQLYRNWSRQ